MISRVMSKDMYTVKQLANLAGVTVRTLHHYDEIGLLKPSAVGENGYRKYSAEALFRLQQIMFFREMDVDLPRIKQLIEQRDSTRCLRCRRIGRHCSTRSSA